MDDGPGRNYQEAARQLWATLREQASEAGRPRSHKGRDGWEWPGALAEAVRAQWPDLTPPEQRRATTQLTRWSRLSLICLVSGSRGLPSVWWVAQDWQPASQTRPRRTKKPAVVIERLGPAEPVDPAELPPGIPPDRMGPPEPEGTVIKLSAGAEVRISVKIPDVLHMDDVDLQALHDLRAVLLRLEADRGDQ